MRVTWFVLFVFAFFSFLQSDLGVVADTGKKEITSPLGKEKKESEERQPANASTELEGQWKVLRQEEDGKPLAIDDDFTIVMSIKARKMTYTFGGSYKEEVMFTLNDKKKPKEIDLSFIDADTKKAKRVLGIYHVNGNSLKICFSRDDGKRPTGFSTKPGDRQYLHSYERQK